MINSEFWLDGEKIPDNYLEKIFRSPPNFPSPDNIFQFFNRSALVIGGRGTGKTTLFRYLKNRHVGIALHIFLPTEFESVTKQTGYGPFASSFPSHLELLIASKSISLLAITIITRLFDKGVRGVETNAVVKCLPKKYWPGESKITPEWVKNITQDLAKAPLEKFKGISEANSLPPLISYLGDRVRYELNKSLLLLFDRADMVTAPSLAITIELLNQPDTYEALVAMRPGHSWHTINRIADSAVAGDHYDVVYLGANPRSENWESFVEEAVGAQPFVENLGGLQSIPREIKEWVIALSRDSIRTALELFGSYVMEERSQVANLIWTIDRLRKIQIASASLRIQQFHPDFKKLLRDIRKAALNENNVIVGPVLLQIEEQSLNLFFPTISDHFIEEALRTGAFVILGSDSWIPGLRLSEVEISPILLWENGDPRWTNKTAKTTTVNKTDKQLLDTYVGGKPKSPSAFIAFRVKNSDSKYFRQKIEEAVKTHPYLTNCIIKDGSILGGIKWAPEIRDRIKRASLAVGDITGMHPDVIFELGFAYGLGKPIIPVVANPSQVSESPDWIRAWQILHYSSQEGTNAILKSIIEFMSGQEYKQILSPKKADPYTAVWLRQVDWNKHPQDQFESWTKRFDLTPKFLFEEQSSDEMIDEVMKASFIIINLDGGTYDGLMHFICGVSIANLKNTIGLDKHILVVEKPEHSGRLAAESIKKCPSYIKIVKPNEILDSIDKYGRHLSNWLNKRT